MKVQCAIILSFVYMASVSFADNNNPADKGQGNIANTADQQQRVERSPKYDFGLGKRRYIITQGGPGKKWVGSEHVEISGTWIIFECFILISDVSRITICE